ERAVCEVDDAADAEDQRQAQRQEQVITPEHQAVDDLFEQKDEWHGNPESRCAAPRRGRGARRSAWNAAGRGHILQAFSDLGGASFSSGSLGAGTASPKARKSCLCLDWPLGLTVK